MTIASHNVAQAAGLGRQDDDAEQPPVLGVEDAQTGVAPNVIATTQSYVHEVANERVTLAAQEALG